jgi:DNA-binding response OmpR family regulator
MHDGKHVILYVEDDPDFRDGMRQVLEAHGYEMIEAPTSEEGLRMFKAHRPDLILVDLMMEEIDAGTSLLRELQAEGNTAPVYMVSSVGDTMTSTTDTADLGFSGVFQKPVDTDRLLDVLKSRLNSN